MAPQWLPAEPDRAAQRSDRILWLSIIGAFVVGLGMLGYGAWVLFHLGGEFTKGEGKAMFFGFLLGPFVMALGVYELRHRLRSGAQEPGRHSRGR